MTAAELPGSVQTCTKRPGNGPRARQLLVLTPGLSVPRPGRATLMLIDVWFISRRHGAGVRRAWRLSRGGFMNEVA